MRTSFSIKRALLGRPIATAEEEAHRLSKKIALPVFASDAISSTAYATEEILVVLVAAGAAALSYAVPISLAVTLLLVIVALSYQQTVHAYPSGGGSFVVGSENLGQTPGLIAAAALLVDYVMTVAVSIAAGVAAITAAFPVLNLHKVWLGIGLVIFVGLANLRGVRESGTLFAIPTYSFILLCGAVVLVGVFRWSTGNLHAVPVQSAHEVTHALTVMLVLRAFAGGCSAMTGTEAISNGVPVFKAPESRNASVTLGLMASTLGFLLIGVTWLAHVLRVTPVEGQTVLSEIGRAVYGNGNPLYFFLQIATMMILVLAANTSFNGFPRLAAILAERGFLPRQFMNRGDRLVFSNGIVGLTLLAIVLLVVFNANVNAMIPLYAVGVFTSFTISQAGMVVHWHRLREVESGWRWRATLNGVGAAMTAVVSIVIVISKFVGGAYIVVIAIPLLVLFFRSIKGHYDRVAGYLVPQTTAQLRRLGTLVQVEPKTTVVLFVSQVNEIVARSLYFAKALSPQDVRAVTVKGDDQRLARLEDQWNQMDSGIPLDVVHSPYRELVRPAVQYVRSLEPGPTHMVIVVIPEFVVEHWWEAFLHNQSALRLRGALFLVPWVIVVSIPFHIGAVGGAELDAEGLFKGGYAP